MEILSGVFEGKTTGAPLSLICYNKEHDSAKYEPIKEILRPGHANYTYQEKYGIFDHRGAGRASAGETVCRVAAGAVAKRLLLERGIYPLTFIWQIGDICVEDSEHITEELIRSSPIFCPDLKASAMMEGALDQAMHSNDSLGVSSSAAL
jgi:chorismate synthase